MPMSEFYQRLRGKVGNDLLLMPAVAAIAWDLEGRILVHERPDGTLSLPAGAIEPGETPAQAVVREAFEETGLRLRPDRVAGVVGGQSCRVTLANGHEVEFLVTVFECSIIGGEMLASGDETTRVLFIPVEEARTRLAFRYPDEIFRRNVASAYYQRVSEGLSPTGLVDASDVPPRPPIRATALAIVRSGSRILVYRATESTTGAPFYRPFGGGIDFGEAAEDAVIREVREELGEGVHSPRLLGVLDNRFTSSGRHHHEHVWVFDVRFENEELYAAARLVGREANGDPLAGEWRDMADFGGEHPPLRPDGLRSLLGM